MIKKRTLEEEVYNLQHRLRCLSSALEPLLDNKPLAKEWYILSTISLESEEFLAKELVFYAKNKTEINKDTLLQIRDNLSEKIGIFILEEKFVLIIEAFKALSYDVAKIILDKYNT